MTATTPVATPPPTPADAAGAQVATQPPPAIVATTVDQSAASATTATQDVVQATRLQRAISAADALASGPSESGSTSQAQTGSSGPTASLAGSSSANGATGSAGGTASADNAETGLTQADRVRFVQRVEQAFQDLSGQGGSVRLRISPPDLGSLRIDIKVTKGELTAKSRPIRLRRGT